MKTQQPHQEPAHAPVRPPTGTRSGTGTAPARDRNTNTLNFRNMELDELKQQWEILRKKLNEQEIINKRLMETAVRQKINSISNTNWVNVILFLTTIPFVSIMQARHAPLPPALFYFALFSLTVYCIWDFYLTLLFDKIRKNKLDILSMEKTVLKFKKQRLLNTFSQFIVAIVLVTWGIWSVHDRMMKMNLLELYIFGIAAVFIIGGWFSVRYFHKLNSLKQNLSDLNEFQKE